MVEHYFGKPIDAAKLKEPLLANLGEQAKTYQAQVEDLLKRYKLQRVNCFLCGSDDTSRVEFTVNGISYVRCPVCDLVHVSHKLPDEALYEYYKKGANYAEAYANSQYIYRLDHVARPKVKFIDKYVTANKKGKKLWLDVGSGIGDMLVASQDLGYTAIGLEISEDSINFGRDRLGCDLRNQTLEQFAESRPSDKFSAVSFMGYLDLVSNPMEELARAAKLLRPGGVVGVSVPHFNSFSRAVQQTFPKQSTRGFFLINALMQYTEKAILYAFKNNGFEPVAFWWFGLDAMELINNLTLACPGFRGSPMAKMLWENCNDIQQVFDNKKACDNMLAVARKV
ncbi:MAG: class I SAM-dependent methyltransferase [Candidatus Omnitrophica bacterium]|nr:class I SAM-dependent methyltransferase [Candidatus Omnitrophota bacterium]